MITKSLKPALEELRSGGIIALPTETVYGLAGNAFDEGAVGKIYSTKNRPRYNPLIVHIKSADALSQVARDIPEQARILAKAFWPGPLTLVLKKQPVIPDVVTSGKDTVAVRVPDHPLTLKLLEKLDFPLAAPSANPFGSISPTSAGHVERYFGDTLNVILDGGECRKGIESTIIGFEGGKPVIFRLGSLSLEEIREKVGEVSFRTRSEDHQPAAPGMLLRHYAPSTDTYLVDDVLSFAASQRGKRIGLLLYKEAKANKDIAHQEVLSPSGDLEEAARNLYAAMHRLDHLNLDMIVAEKFPDKGLGRTINDKLERATHREEG